MFARHPLGQKINPAGGEAAIMRQQAAFDARLARLAAHAGNTNATLHIGMDEQLERAAFERKKVRQPAAKPEARTEPLILLLALLSGALAWAWAQWLRVSLMPAGDPLGMLATDLCIGLTAVLLLRAILGLRGGPALVCQLIGMGAALFGLHNLVHLWPEQFARVFPAAWVSGVLSHTAPLSVNLSAFAI